MSRIKKYLNSFRYSFRGIRVAFQMDHNMVFHLASAIAVIAANIVIKVSQSEWLITLTLIGLVLMAEVFNTAIEKLADRVNKERDPLIGQVKDLASGAVLIIGFFAIVCALIIYLPYLINGF